MSTRLLVLGVVRIFAPVHGYLVRRELLSWEVESWASVNPGSVYGALRTLTKDGLLSEAGTESAGGRPARTSYRLTPEGESAFFSLLHKALWEVDMFDPTGLLTGLCFLRALPRDEAVAAMAARALRLEASLAAAEHSARRLEISRAAPSHTVELFEVSTARLRGELEWCRGIHQRLLDGAYTLHGEPGATAGPDADGRWPGAYDAVD